MGLALRLAKKGYGATSPNPMVGAVLIRKGKIIGMGWHHRAGEPHAEIEALKDAERNGRQVSGATLFVTLEPCCTHGRTPPCTEAILASGLKRVVAGATDPNPKHAGKGFEILRAANIQVQTGVLNQQCEELNESFNHWIVHRIPFVLVKAAMTLDGKIATASGESKWITGVPARNFAMKLRQGADAIIVGINTILADDPSLTVRLSRRAAPSRQPRRIVLDALARTPLDSQIVRDNFADRTTVIVSTLAPHKRVRALMNRVKVTVAPLLKRVEGPESQGQARIDAGWLLKQLGKEHVISLLVEGGGEVQASFLLHAQRVAFFYAPKILGGRNSRRAIGGPGATGWNEVLNLMDVRWRKIGRDWFLGALIQRTSAKL
jgi:diaminohydroxyphosphoribosylaminopyrimidine deaminase/5-amino-6-(5-phosphoribosylamino)uracil reductase